MNIRSSFTFLFFGCAGLFEPIHAAPPQNDLFIDRIALAGFPATAAGTITEATMEAGEPLPDGYEYGVGKSIWYEWTSPTTGVVQIDTYGSATYQVHPIFGFTNAYPLVAHPAVWQGNSVDALTEVRCGGNAQCRYVPVVSGTTYRIAVYWAQSGSYFDWGDTVLNIRSDETIQLSGRVTGPDGTTPLSNILAQAYVWNASWNDWTPAFWAFTDSAGQYTIRGLSNETYRIGFFDWANRYGTPDYLTEYYNNHETIASAEDVLISGSHVYGIDASLDVPGGISGRVTGPDGVTPLKGIYAEAYRWNDDWSDWQWMGEARSDSEGEFLIRGLPGGTYRIRFTDWQNAHFLAEVYENVQEISVGADITVVSGANVTGINATLMHAEPRIVGILNHAEGVEVQFEGIPWRYYRLQRFRPDVGVWEDTPARVMCEDESPTASLLDDLDATVQFWRVRRDP